MSIHLNLTFPQKFLLFITTVVVSSSLYLISQLYLLVYKFSGKQPTQRVFLDPFGLISMSWRVGSKLGYIFDLIFSKFS